MHKVAFILHISLILRCFYQQRKLKKRSVDHDLDEFSKQNNETLKNTTGTLPDSPIINSTITETRQILFNIFLNQTRMKLNIPSPIE